MRIRTAGWATAVAGVLGAASGIAIIVWSPEVADTHYSYPFGGTSYAVAQSWFAVQHLGLIAGMYVLTHLAWPTSSRFSRAGLVLGLVGMAGLTVCELFAITARNALVGSDIADAVDMSYGLPVIAIGLGWIVAGVGLARDRLLPGAGRWLPLAIGAYVFVALVPSLMGSMEAGRVGIGVWMILFAWFGLALVAIDDDPPQ